MDLSIVYYIYINPDRNWKIIVEGQLNDLKISEIEYKQIYIHICCEQKKLIDDCKKLIEDIIIPQSEVIYFESYINQFEYPGLKLLYDLSQKSDSIFLYIHSKGMVFNNHYAIRSIAEQPTLRGTLYYWKKAINILMFNVNINKVGLWPSDKGYIWLNFFYIRSSYLKNPPIISDYRYYYEEYIGDANNKCKDYTDCYSLILNKIGCYDKHEVMKVICNLKNDKLLNNINTHFSKLIKEYTFFYGSDEKKINITDLIYEKCLKDNFIFIPAGDFNRAAIFGDPLDGVLKSIFIKFPDEIEDKFDYNMSIYIDINEHNFYRVDTVPQNILNLHKTFDTKLKEIQSNLKISYGLFDDEYPEQIMTVRYLTGDEKVLEIGSNIGRNSLIIAYLLVNSSNLVTLECDINSFNKLIFNRNVNNFNFHCENAALSKRKLIQRGCDTFVSDDLLPGYNNVNTITFEELKQKYPINFDTLVIDCEGAFYYILLDSPEILCGIKLIIMENDYHFLEHKEYIDTVLKQNGFYVDYSKPGGWGPCEQNFYEVWLKKI